MLLRKTRAIGFREGRIKNRGRQTSQRGLNVQRGELRAINRTALKEGENDRKRWVIGQPFLCVTIPQDQIREVANSEERRGQGSRDRSQVRHVQGRVGSLVNLGISTMALVNLRVRTVDLRPGLFCRRARYCQIKGIREIWIRRGRLRKIRTGGEGEDGGSHNWPRT